MPANTSPIFTLTPKTAWSSSNPLSTVNTGTGVSSYDGTTNATSILTAGSNGSFVQKLVFESGGTNAVSIARIFINNGSTNGTAANNVLFTQFSLPATTASATLATTHIEVPLSLQLPAGYKIFVSLGAAANLASGWYVCGIYGDY
jgi:hypothetical protein